MTSINTHSIFIPRSVTTARTITKSENGISVAFHRSFGNGQEVSGAASITKNEDGSVTVSRSRERPNSTTEFEKTFIPKCGVIA